MWTTLYKRRDADDVIAEMKSYQQKYNITAVQLYDLTAITKRSYKQPLEPRAGFEPATPGLRNQCSTN